MRLSLFRVLLIFVSIAIAFGSPSPSAHIANGTLRGRYLHEFQQDLFLGVPYSKAPRLAKPLPINETWPAPLDASQYGPTCYGFGSNQLLNLTQSEDCLNLNIIRPAVKTFHGRGLPIVFWMYGGGFRQGSSADPMWNLSYIVQQSVKQEQPMIAVSINYRLSFLGFPGGQQVVDAGITNLGLRDQRAALQWVHENIASFGGDPSKVTIWGESAGSISATNQIVAYGGESGNKLFRSAILVSGFAAGIAQFKTAEGTQAAFDAILANANCTQAADALACLRAAPLSIIYPFEDQNGAAPWGVFVDGDFLRQRPADEIAADHIARVPILLGHNSDEGLFVMDATKLLPNSTIELDATTHQLFPNATNKTVSQLLAAYPPDSPAPPYSLAPTYPWCAAMNAAHLACSSQYRRAAGIFGDFLVDAPRRYLASQWTKLGLPAYSFRFAADPTSIPIQYFTMLGPGFSLHGAELAYEFGLPGGFNTPINYYPPVKNMAGHVQLSKEMIKRWIAFVHYGNPNRIAGNSSVQWPGYHQSAANFVFNATDQSVDIHVEADEYRAEGIAIFNENIPGFLMPG